MGMIVFVRFDVLLRSGSFPVPPISGFFQWTSANHVLKKIIMGDGGQYYYSRPKKATESFTCICS